MVSAFVGVTEFEAGITALVTMTMTVKAAVYGLFLPIAIALMVL